MRELGSEVAGGSEDSQQIQPKSKTQLSSTGRPVSEQSTGLFTQLEVIDIDFRVSGLPHANVKQAVNFRVRELVKKIDSHAHREALQADLQQNSVYFLVESESSQNFNKWRPDTLSIPHYKRSDPMVLGTAKLKHRKSTMWPTTRGRDVSKEITKEFTIVSYETQYIVPLPCGCPRSKISPVYLAQ